ISLEDWECILFYSVCVDLFFFFFQAEDGIRDWSVTGVQTCALPISNRRLWGAPPRRRLGQLGQVRRRRHRDGRKRAPAAHRNARSEERRVGKECRSRWSPEH